jgi:hypothetical protein
MSVNKVSCFWNAAITQCLSVYMKQSHENDIHYYVKDTLILSYSEVLIWGLRVQGWDLFIVGPDCLLHDTQEICRTHQDHAGSLGLPGMHSCFVGIVLTLASLFQDNIYSRCFLMHLENARRTAGLKKSHTGYR